VGNFLTTFKEFPPRQTPAKFNLDDVMKTLTETTGNN
jgi:arylsulfatase